jgi:hypothetical protein
LKDKIEKNHFEKQTTQKNFLKKKKKKKKQYTDYCNPWGNRYE